MWSYYTKLILIIWLHKDRYSLEWRMKENNVSGGGGEWVCGYLFILNNDWSLSNVND